MSLQGKGSVPIVFAASIIFLLCSPAFGSDDPIANLTSFSGTVLIKSKGSWGVVPKVGLPLYSEDKVVTRIGNAIVTFTDGTVLEIKNNSNVLIQEREKEEGIITKVKVLERRVLLLLGKMFFKTGKEKVETRFETATAVIGIRGTSGILSIGPEGKTYILFTEGGPAFTLGEFIEGVAKEVPVELAMQNPAQRATFVANAAADQLRRTEEKFTAGLVPPVQVDLAKAISDESAAREVLALSQALLVSPDPKVVEQAKRQIAEARKAIEEAKEAQRRALDEGADPEFRIFSPTDPGFEVPAMPGLQKK